MRAIANVQPAGLVLDGGRSQIHARAHVAVVRIAEEGGDGDVRGPSLKRRNAAIGDAVVAEVFVAQSDLRAFVRASSVRVGLMP